MAAEEVDVRVRSARPADRTALEVHIGQEHNQKGRAETNPASALAPADRGYFPIRLFAFSGVIAVVCTVTTGSTFAAQSSRIDLAISIACLAPVG